MAKPAHGTHGRRVCPLRNVQVRQGKCLPLAKGGFKHLCAVLARCFFTLEYKAMHGYYCQCWRGLFNVPTFISNGHCKIYGEAGLKSAAVHTVRKRVSAARRHREELWNVPTSGKRTALHVCGKKCVCVVVEKLEESSEMHRSAGIPCSSRACIIFFCTKC